MSASGLFRQLLGILVVVVANIIIPGSGMALWQAMLTGFVSGAVSSGTLKGGLIGAFSAGLFYGIGSAFGKVAAANGGSLTANQTIGKIIAHGIAGGVMSTLQGGKFGDGFLAAGVTQAFAPMIDKIGGGASSAAPLRIAAAALLGGTVSVVSGGKFANGAITGAFSRAFNDEGGHEQPDKESHEYNSLSDPICHTRETSCTVQNVAELLYPNRMAPGTSVGYIGNQPVTKIWDPYIGFVAGHVYSTFNWSTYSGMNITLWDHVFKPGIVMRSVVSVRGSIFIRTTGVGTGNFATINQYLGPLVFKPLDQSIKAAYDSKYN